MVTYISKHGQWQASADHMVRGSTFLRRPSQTAGKDVRPNLASIMPDSSALPGHHSQPPVLLQCETAAVCVFAAAKKEWQMPDVALQEKVALSGGTPAARQAACWKMARAVQHQAYS